MNRVQTEGIEDGTGVPLDLFRYKSFLQVLQFVFFAGLTLFLPACGSGGGGGAGAPAIPVDPPVGTEPPPVLQLAGDPAVPVLPLLPNVFPARTAREDVEEGLLLSRISLVLHRDATVADFNAAAQKVGATALVFSHTNSPFLTLAVPRRANGAALKQAVGLLRNQPGVFLAVPGREPAMKELPPGNGVTVAADHLDHLWPAGFPAAWNARALALAECGSRKVTVIVPDLYFGSPFGGFRDQVPGATENFDAIPLPPRDPDAVNIHGYDVAAILAGKFDGAAPTGANPFPDCLKIVPVDVSGLDFFQTVEVIRAAVEREAGKVIVNSSVGYALTLCGLDGTDPCADEDVRNAPVPELQDEILFRVAAGVTWAAFAIQPGVVDDTLLAVAAGNDRNKPLGERYAGFRSARLASPFGVATQLPSLPATLTSTPGPWTTTEAGFPALTFDQARIDQARQDFQIDVIPSVSDRNLALVGSTTQAPVVRQFLRSSFSNEADLYAVGEGVTGLVSPLLEGTSFSTPQVAGLASYLWLLDADLRSRPVEETLRLIRATSRSNGTLDHFIDAYGAVLALDALHQTKQIRKALLDVNGDGLFNPLDLQAFADAYQLSNANRFNPSARDYSRFDLNGDGFTGGSATERFDLDADGLDAGGAPRINSVTTTIEGVAVTMNEAALSDLQILCHYAYAVDLNGAPLIYDPSGEAIAERGRLLSGHCLGAQMAAVLPPSFATSATLNVTVQMRDSSGGFQPSPNLLVQLTPTCATVSPASGRTNASGQFSATVTFETNCAELFVVVTARIDDGSPVLAQQTARASQRGLGVRLNRIATTKGEATNSSSILVQEQKTSAYPPQQGRDYTPPDLTLNGSGVAPPQPPSTTYTYTAAYSEDISPIEVQTDIITGGTLRLTVSCSAVGSTGFSVVTTGLADPILDFPADRRFDLTVTGTLSGTNSETNFEGFEAKFHLRNLHDSSTPAIRLTSIDQVPSRSFTSLIPIVGPASYDLGMSATAFCFSGSPERSASAEVSLTFSVAPIE